MWTRRPWQPASLVWIIPQLSPGEAARRDVLCLCQRPADNAVSRVTVTANENISETAEAAIRILPPRRRLREHALPDARTPAAGQLTVEISELGDPIRIGEATDYEIRIRNARAAADQNVVLKIEFPAGLRFDRLSGPVARRNVSADGRLVEVSPIREVPQRAKRFLPFMSKPPGSRWASTSSAWW